MSALQLGDDSTSRTYSWDADDLWVSTVQPFTAPAPSAPSSVAASVNSPTSVQVTWGASTESGGTIASYQVARNGVSVATVSAPATSYPDTVQPGTTATYMVTAVDSAGTPSAPGTSNQVTTPLYVTGFDSNSAGALTGWTSGTGVTVQSQVAHTVPNAASLSAATGTQSFAIQTLGASSPTMYAQVWVQVSNLSPNTMTLMGLRSANGQVARVFLQSNGAVSVANNVDPAHPSYVGTTVLSTGTWYELTFGINETAGTIQVWVNNAPVQFNTANGAIANQNLTPANAQGPSPMNAFQLGDDSTQHTYACYADDVTVSPAQPAL